MSGCPAISSRISRVSAVSSPRLSGSTCLRGNTWPRKLTRLNPSQALSSAAAALCGSTADRSCSSSSIAARGPAGVPAGR